MDPAADLQQTAPRRLFVTTLAGPATGPASVLSNNEREGERGGGKTGRGIVRARVRGFVCVLFKGWVLGGYMVQGGWRPERENVALRGETMTCSYDLTFILIHTDRGWGGWRMEPGGVTQRLCKDYAGWNRQDQPIPCW